MIKRSSSSRDLSERSGAAEDRLRRCQPVSASAGRVLAAFRERLEWHQYEAVYRIHCYELAPRWLSASLRQTMPHAPRATQELYQLLYFREPLGRTKVEALLGGDLLAGLLEVGVLQSVGGGDTIVSSYKLEVIGDTLLLVDEFLDPVDSVYYDEDSQFLRAVIRPQEGNVCLDLCSGTGVQGLRCAPLARRVDLVDVNPAAVRLATLNVLLNGMEDRVRTHHGDLWDALPADAVYDHIVCNPPLMPVPDAMPYALCGHGGYDGLAIVRRILEQLDAHLSGQGRCTLIGACAGNEKEPAVAVAADKYLRGSLQWTLFLLVRMPLRDWLSMIAATAARLHPNLSRANFVIRARSAYGRDFESTVVYSYLLLCQRRGSENPCRIFDYSRVGHRSFWFVNRGTVAR